MRLKRKIKIDYKKCSEPEKCRKCLQICEPGVFIITFTDKDYHNPQKWLIIPVFPQICTDCNKCVIDCPEKAILVKNKKVS